MSAELQTGLLDAALEISARRRELLLRAKAARQRDDKSEVYRLIDQLVPESVADNVVQFPTERDR